MSQAAQPGLFDQAPLASRRDPVTSHMAAAEHTASGRRGEAKAALPAFLRGQTAPMTSYEVARVMGLDRHATARRLPDLANHGLVHRCAIRDCEITRRPALTWSAGPAGCATTKSPGAPRAVCLACRCGNEFSAPHSGVAYLGGAHCPDCHRFARRNMSEGRRWFRFYGEVYRDPKIQKLPNSLFVFWVNCLCLFCEYGELPIDSDAAFALRMPEAKFAAGLKLLQDKELFDGREPHGWKKRQYLSDVSTERVKRFRKRARSVSETAPESDTETETDTDTETETGDLSITRMRARKPQSVASYSSYAARVARRAKRQRARTVRRSGGSGPSQGSRGSR